MPKKKSRGNPNFMKSIQRPVVWAVAVLFGVGIIWWSVAQYIGSGSQGNQQNTGATVNFSETVGGLTKDGTPLSDPNYWITYSEYETSVRDTLTNLRSQGYTLDPYFEMENYPSEMGIRYDIFMSLIDQKTLLLYATENEVLPTTAQVESETKRIVDQYVADEETRSAIIYQYGSVDAFSALIKDYVATQLLTVNVANKAIPDMNSRFQTFVEENLEGLKFDYERVDADHILVSDEASAVEIKAMIENGEVSFAEAATRYSIDTGTAASGGALGEFRRGEMVPEFEDASFDATPGVLVGPVESQFGYHLILVNNKSTFDSFEEFVNTPSYQTEMNQFENAEFDRWIAEYRVENNLSHVINDPDLQMYSKYDEARRDRQEAKRFLEELESDYFDESGNVLIGESYLPVVFYTQLVEDEVTNLRYQVFDLEDLEDLLLALPATATSMSIEDINDQLETIPATNTELRSVLSEAKRAREYMTEFSVESLEEVQEMLADKRKVYDETNSRFESSVRYLYSVMPNSTKVVNYMYQIDGNNPEVAYMYNENSYNMNVRPLLENPALLDSYLQYYSEYFGAQARSLLIDSPIQSIEGDLNRKVINSTEAATDLKISALYLLVDIYEKMANLEQNEPLMEIYLMAEKHYLEKLLEFNPEDEAIRSLIETIEFYISELNASQTIDATETADSTEFETSSDIDHDTEVTPGELSVPFEIEAPSQIGDVDLDVSLDSEGPNETNN
ncbi:peptidylprolyl isomerase [Mesotoga sp. UBA5557]|jgi:DNA-binding transcriptional MerR regulator|uniref:peptidylprolyl isomerase n=1 Tax=Mesotoga sp. UBA5557 TaxID=1946857 RepID=UPI000A669611|nr:peptidylprolyl isomerase [Mesotoga sp. UBA5557]